jgi:hypothetical protein
MIMSRKTMMEIGVFFDKALKGQRRWIYREYLSNLNNPNSARVCNSSLAPGLAVQGKAPH